MNFSIYREERGVGCVSSWQCSVSQRLNFNSWLSLFVQYLQATAGLRVQLSYDHNKFPLLLEVCLPLLVSGVAKDNF